MASLALQGPEFISVARTLLDEIDKLDIGAEAHFDLKEIVAEKLKLRAKQDL